MFKFYTDFCNTFYQTSKSCMFEKLRPAVVHLRDQLRATYYLLLRCAHQPVTRVRHCCHVMLTIHPYFSPANNGNVPLCCCTQSIEKKCLFYYWSRVATVRICCGVLSICLHVRICVSGNSTMYDKLLCVE